MLTCQTLYDDIATALYSKHRFFFRPQSIDDLKILFRLRPSTLKHMTSLTVRLDLAPYQHCHCHFKPRRLESEWEENPFVIPATQQCAFLALWGTALTHILDHITPNRLSFHLVCDVKSHEAAALATRPLTQVNHLADCSIRLGSHRDRLLENLARKVVLHATKQTPDQQQPFRYLELPSEVRRQILENTDLVTPLCEVEWNPTDGFYLRYRHLEGYLLGSESREGWFGHLICRYHEQSCFCRRYHSAFDLTCRCWQPPQSLFMVCRSMGDEAESVFYSKNRIVITPGDRCDLAPKVNPARLEASVFFNTFRPSTFRHLRFLEIVIPPFETGYCPDRSAVHADLNAGIARIKDSLNLPNLVLRVYMANYSYYGCRVTSFRANMTKQQAFDIWFTYHRILLPFRAWVEEGLKRFYIHLTYPQYWTRSTRRKVAYADQNFLKKKTNLFEGLMRDMVMGKEHVGRCDQGREDVEESQWLAYIEHELGMLGGEPHNDVLWYSR